MIGDRRRGSISPSSTLSLTCASDYNMKLWSLEFSKLPANLNYIHYSLWQHQTVHTSFNKYEEIVIYDGFIFNF